MNWTDGGQMVMTMMTVGIYSLHDLVSVQSLTEIQGLPNGFFFF